MKRSMHRVLSALTASVRRPSRRIAVHRRPAALAGALVVVASGLGAAPAHAQIACDNDSFQASIAGGFLPNAPTPDYVVLDKTPLNYAGAFVDDCYAPGNGECWGEPRYKLYATFNNITEWRGKVCARSVETIPNTHWITYQDDANANCPVGGGNWCTIYVGPEVGFQYRGADNVWRWLESDNGDNANWEIPANSTHWYHWSASSNTPTDFRIVIRYAKPSDRFDLMMDK